MPGHVRAQIFYRAVYEGSWLVQTPSSTRAQTQSGLSSGACTANVWKLTIQCYETLDIAQTAMHRMESIDKPSKFSLSGMCFGLF